MTNHQSNSTLDLPLWAIPSFSYKLIVAQAQWLLHNRGLYPHNVVSPKKKCEGETERDCFALFLMLCLFENCGRGIKKGEKMLKEEMGLEVKVMNFTQLYIYWFERFWGLVGKNLGLILFFKDLCKCSGRVWLLMAWGNMSGDWMFLIIYLKSLVWWDLMSYELYWIYFFFLLSCMAY